MLSSFLKYSRKSIFNVETSMFHIDRGLISIDSVAKANLKFVCGKPFFTIGKYAPRTNRRKV